MFGKIVTVSATIATLMGCSGQSDETEVAPTETPASGKVLVVYYSWGGNTRNAATFIAEATQGTLFELKPVKAYPTDYQACCDYAKDEIKRGVLPELATTIDTTNYGTIFIGSPNWWGTMAPPVASFIAKAQLQGKRIVPFFTHGGGGMQRCEADMVKAIPGATFVDAKTFSGSRVTSQKDEITAWALSAIGPQK